MKELTYSEALSDGLVWSMERDPNIFVTGIAVDYPSGVFGTTSLAFERFGKSRVFESPSMENALTGIAIGAAAVGKRPIIVHPRNDFMFLSFDQLINVAAKWSYMFNGKAGRIPLVVRSVIGKGWGQGATHSQSIQSTLAHFPGLTVVMPAFPDDARNLTIRALRHNSPVVILEHRALYNTKGIVSDYDESFEFGKAKVIREGRDVTIVGVSYMAFEALRAAEELAKVGVSAEVVDLRSIRPMDETAILNSLEKTGRLIVADTSWELCGVASEVAAIAVERGFKFLKTGVRRVTLPNCPAPVSRILEEAFYPTASDIIREVLESIGSSQSTISSSYAVDEFKGPY